MVPKDFNHKKLQSTIDKLQKESERACGVLAVATLDTLLELLLRCSMLPEPLDELFEGLGPLQPFSAKIDVAYAYGLIGETERIDLHLLRKIRNAFAHDVNYELSFNTPKIASRVKLLKLPHMTKAVREDCKPENANRWHFELCVALLCTSLTTIRMKHAKPASKPKLLRPSNEVGPS